MNNNYSWKLDQQEGYVDDVSSLVNKQVNDAKGKSGNSDGSSNHNTNGQESEHHTNGNNSSQKLQSQDKSDSKTGPDSSAGIQPSSGINISHPAIPPMPPLSQVPPLSQMPQISQMGQGPQLQQVPQLQTLQMPSGSPVSQSGAQGGQGSPEMSEDDQDGQRAKRPLSSTRRAAQNRSAQKAFRQRKERYIKDLEAQAAETKGLKQTIEELRAENLRLRDYTIALQSRIIELGSDTFNQTAESGQNYNKLNQGQDP